MHNGFTEWLEGVFYFILCSFPSNVTCCFVRVRALTCPFHRSLYSPKVQFPSSKSQFRAYYHVCKIRFFFMELILELALLISFLLPSCYVLCDYSETFPVVHHLYYLGCLITTTNSLLTKPPFSRFKSC